MEQITPPQSDTRRYTFFVPLRNGNVIHHSAQRGEAYCRSVFKLYSQAELKAVADARIIRSTPEDLERARKRIKDLGLL